MIMEFFIDKMERLIEEFYPPVKRLNMGQILWFAVAKDEKPSYGKSMENTRIVQGKLLSGVLVFPLAIYNLLC